MVAYHPDERLFGFIPDIKKSLGRIIGQRNIAFGIRHYHAVGHIVENNGQPGPVSRNSIHQFFYLRRHLTKGESQFAQLIFGLGIDFLFKLSGSNFPGGDGESAYRSGCYPGDKPGSQNNQQRSDYYSRDNTDRYAVYQTIDCRQRQRHTGNAQDLALIQDGHGNIHHPLSQRSAVTGTRTKSGIQGSHDFRTTRVVLHLHRLLFGVAQHRTVSSNDGNPGPGLFSQAFGQGIEDIAAVPA